MPELIKGPSWSEFIITDTGLNLRTEVIAEKGSIDFVYAEIGEGKPTTQEEIPNISSVIIPKGRVPVVKSFMDNNNNHIMFVKIDNKDFNEEILVTEVAVYAKKVGTDTIVLYGYAYCIIGAAILPPNNAQRRAWNLVFDTKISRTSDVTIIYDGSGVFVPYDVYDAHLPTHKIVEIPEASYLYTYTLYESIGGMPLAMPDLCSSSVLTEVPCSPMIDLNSGTTSIRTIQRYSGRAWNVSKYGDRAYLLVADGDHSGDALILVRR